MDKKARKILIDTYWSPSGWNEKYLTSKKDFEYAKSKGLMFEKYKTSHNKLIQKIQNLFLEVNKQKITDNFLSSLSKRQLELRSALSSYAVARTIPIHSHIGKNGCLVCGEYSKSENDINVLNFERIFWGGVRHEHPIYVFFDLTEHLKTEHHKPTQTDFSIFKIIIETIGNQTENASPNDLEKSLAKVIKSNKQERSSLLDKLGIIGLLETEDHKGYYNQFITNENINKKHKGGKNDWSYPIMWWKGKDGINKSVYDFYFGDYSELKN